MNEEERIKKQRDNLVNTLDMLIESGVPISHIVIANKQALRIRIDKLLKENEELKEKIRYLEADKNEDILKHWRDER